MSRFPELFEEAIEEVVIGEAFLIEDLAEHIARHIVERAARWRAEVRIAASYPIERTTPVTKLPTQEMVCAHRDRGGDEQGVRRIVGVEAAGINACPCAQGLVKGRPPSGYSRPASTSATSSGSSSSSRWRRTTSAASGRSTSAPTTRSTPSSWSTSSRASMSAPVYELLKRPDELFVVEHAHLQPRFVEDSVRLSLKGALDAYPQLVADDFLSLTPGKPRDHSHARCAR